MDPNRKAAWTPVPERGSSFISKFCLMVSLPLMSAPASPWRGACEQNTPRPSSAETDPSSDSASPGAPSEAHAASRPRGIPWDRGLVCGFHAFPRLGASWAPPSAPKPRRLTQRHQTPLVNLGVGSPCRRRPLHPGQGDAPSSWVRASIPMPGD